MPAGVFCKSALKTRLQWRSLESRNQAVGPHETLTTGGLFFMLVRSRSRFFAELFKLSFYNELVGPSPATTRIDGRRANRRQTVFRAVKVQGWLAYALS